MLNVYLICSWNDTGEIILGMSINKEIAIKKAEEYYSRLDYHVWVEEGEIDLNYWDLDPYYDPNYEGIIWEKGKKGEEC